MLQIHRRAQAVDFGADEVPREHALQQPLIVAPRGVARRGRTPVACGREFERLRLGRAHAARDESQALRALLHIDDGAHQVALFAPKLQQAAAVRLGNRVARRAHIEQHAPILKQRRRRMIREIRFDDLRQSRGRSSFAGLPGDRSLSLG